MLTLRGHHLLCLPRFRGRGYSTGFSENMWRIVKKLEEHPEQMVCLTAGADDICRVCPHLSDSACLLDEGGQRVQARDARVLSLLGLNPGNCVPYKEVRKQLRRMGQRPLEEACRGCRWFTLCFGFAEPEIP